MDLTMTTNEREEFLAEVHVGVIAIERRAGPPLNVPIWYSYEPDGHVVVLTDANSLKARLLASAQQFSLCAQDETHGAYRYVSVEGPVVSSMPADLEADNRPMAHRYLGQEFGDLYADSLSDTESIKVTMRPDRWFSVDYTKLA